MKKKPLTFVNKKSLKLTKKSGKAVASKNVPFAKLIYASLAINAISILGIIYFKKLLPPEVPLFYGLAEGEEQLTKSSYLLLAPITSFALLGLDVFISLFIKKDLLKKTLIVTGFCVSVFSFVTLVMIFLLIGPF